jgi:hypothetical protein
MNASIVTDGVVGSPGVMMGEPVMGGHAQQPPQEEKARDDRTPTPFQIAPSISEPLHPTSYAVTRVDVRETRATTVYLRTAIFGKKSKIQIKTGETNVKCFELLSSVVIGGATGTNAAKVNGIYEPTIEEHNGKLLFQKRGMKDHWLHFDASTGFWIVSSTAGKDTKNNLSWWPLSYSTDRDLQDPKRAVAWKILNGSAWEDQGDVKCVGGEYSNDKNTALRTVNAVLPDVCKSSTFEDQGNVKCVELLSSVVIVEDPKRAVAWKILNGSAWEDQGDVKCVGGEYSNYKNTALRTVNAVLPDVCKSSIFEDQGNVKCIEVLSSVVIGGATGTNAAKVNGIYEPTVEVYNGKLLFQKRGMKDLIKDKVDDDISVIEEDEDDHWLHFDASTGFWIVSSTAGKDSKNNLRCWCHSTDRDLQDPKRAVAWKILNGQKVEDIERSTWQDKLQQEEAAKKAPQLEDQRRLDHKDEATLFTANKEAEERQRQAEQRKRQLEEQRHNFGIENESTLNLVPNEAFSAENAEEAKAKAEAEAQAAAEKAAAEKAAADAKVVNQAII